MAALPLFLRNVPRIVARRLHPAALAGLLLLAAVPAFAIDPLIYWTESSANRIRRANLDGSQVETLITNQNSPIDLVLDPGHDRLYFTDYGLNAVRTAHLDGSGLRTLFGNFDGAYGIDMNQSHLYWVDAVSSTLMHSDVNEGDYQVLSNALDSPHGLAIYVPEPNSLLLLICGAAGWLRTRR